MVVLGIGLALWLAIMRPPVTPALPTDPDTGLEPAILRVSQSGFTPVVWSGVDDPELGLGVDGLPCGLTAGLESKALGWLYLGVYAPCHVGALADVTYGPIQFSTEVGPRGYFRTQVPALGSKNEAKVRIGTLAAVAQANAAGPSPLVAGLSWIGETRLSLNVWESGRPVTPEQPGTGQLRSYGDPKGARSEIYVVSAGDTLGSVRLHVDAFASGQDCGRVVTLQAFDTLGDDLSTRESRIEMPDCAATTAKLRLRNLLDDLRAGLE